MHTQTSATVIDGVPWPDTLLPLPNNTRVQLTLQTIETDQDAAAAWQSLKTRLTQRPVHGGGKRFTREELHERG